MVTLLTLLLSVALADSGMPDYCFQTTESNVISEELSEFPKDTNGGKVQISTKKQVIKATYTCPNLEEEFISKLSIDEKSHLEVDSSDFGQLDIKALVRFSPGVDDLLSLFKENFASACKEDSIKIFQYCLKFNRSKTDPVILSCPIIYSVKIIPTYNKKICSSVIQHEITKVESVTVN